MACGGDCGIVSGDGVKFLRFENLAVEYAAGTGFDFKSSIGVEIVGCSFSCVYQGIRIEGENNRVRRCDLSRIGATGIYVRGGDRRILKRCDSVIENCRVRDFGVFCRTYAPGVGVDGVGVTVRGNEICDAPHLGVQYGGNEHLFESNEVHHVLLETADAGAFYTGRDWTTQGNVLRFNYVHDTGRPGGDTSTVGMYFDDCDCGDAVVSNVFRRVARAILIGGGRDHPVVGNVFDSCRIGVSVDVRGLTWKTWNVPGGSWDLEGKAKKLNYTEDPWRTAYPRLARIMRDSPREPLYNPVVRNVFVDCSEATYRLDGDKKVWKPVVPKMEAKDNVVYTTATNVPVCVDERLEGGFTIRPNVSKSEVSRFRSARFGIE